MIPCKIPCKKSLPFLCIIFLPLVCTAILEALQAPITHDLEHLTIPEIQKKFAKAPGQAHLQIGKKLLDGLGLPAKNPKSAFKQFLIAGKSLVEGRNAAVKMCVNENQCFSEYIEENFQELLNLAQAGNQDAFSLLYRLGECRGIPVDLSAKILDSLKPIYENNHQLLFKTAIEIALKDTRRGINILETLATTYNYVEAQLELGECYQKGNFVQQNLPRALKYYMKAANQGDPRAQTVAALLFLKGKGTDQDLNRAFELFEKAAEQNFPNALFNVGVFYLEGYVDGVHDVAIAISYFKKAAQHGNPFALTTLGELAQIGIDDQGVQGEPDLHKAFELFKQASVTDISANYNLAFFMKPVLKATSTTKKQMRYTNRS